MPTSTQMGVEHNSTPRDSNRGQHRECKSRQLRGIVCIAGYPLHPRNCRENHESSHQSRGTGPFEPVPLSNLKISYTLKEWCRGVKIFPRFSLPSLVGRLLAIPVTSASPEGLFSSSGNTMTKKRCSLWFDHFGELHWTHVFTWDISSDLHVHSGQKGPRDGLDVPSFFCIFPCLLYNQRGSSEQRTIYLIADSDKLQVCFHEYGCRKE